MTRTKLIFLGSHIRSTECLRYVIENVPSVDVIGLVLNRSYTGDYDHQAARTLTNKYDIPILSIESLGSLQYDLGASVLYDCKLPSALVDQPPRGLVNIHLGPLPRFRGVNSVYHAIRRARLDNNWIFGVTLHYIDHGLDTGPIIDMIDVPFSENDTAYDLYMRATGKILELFAANIRPLVSNEGRVPSTAQSGPSFYFRRSDMVLEVDLNASPDEVYDAVRALTFPGKKKPFAYVGTRKIYLSLHECS